MLNPSKLEFQILSQGKPSKDGKTFRGKKKKDVKYSATILQCHFNLVIQLELSN